MRTPSISSVGYTPNLPPEDAAEMRRFVFEEFQRVAGAIQALAAGHIDVSYAAPTKPRKGDIRYADGTSWNPGSGAGIYYYNGSAWALLG